MRRAAIGLFVLCAALFLAPGGTRGASFYNPCSIVSLASTSSDTPSTITTTFGVGVDPQTCASFERATDRPGEWLPRNVVQFTPPDWYVATDADIADGEHVGELNSRQTFGLFDNGCNQVLNVDFVLLDGTTDTTNIVEPKPPGTPDRLKPLSLDGDGDGVPAAAEKWPSYLTPFAEQQGMDLTKLRARIVGINTTDIVGTTVIWNYLVFEPGARVARGLAADPLLGYATIGVLQDPTALTSSGDPVTDFCAPIWSEHTLRSSIADTATYRRNPHDGVYNFVTYSVPSPDADNDAIENALDPCPYDPNASGWDPRGVLQQGISLGDEDVDSLPEECDPDPNSKARCYSDYIGGSHDEDCDEWMNRIDNCPLVANGLAQKDIPGVGNQLDTDGDGIGDVCDHDQGTPDGQNQPVCNVSTVTVGFGGTPLVDPKLLEPCGLPATPAALPRTGGSLDGGGMSSLSLLSAGLLLAGLALAGVALKRLHSGL